MNSKQIFHSLTMIYPEAIPEVTEVEMFGSDNQVVTIDQGGRAIALPVVPMFVDEDGQIDTGNLAYNKFNEVIYN